MICKITIKRRRKKKKIGRNIKNNFLFINKYVGWYSNTGLVNFISCMQSNQNYSARFPSLSHSVSLYYICFCIRCFCSLSARYTTSVDEYGVKLFCDCHGFCCLRLGMLHSSNHTTSIERSNPLIYKYKHPIQLQLNLRIAIAQCYGRRRRRRLRSSSREFHYDEIFIFIFI